MGRLPPAVAGKVTWSPILAAQDTGLLLATVTHMKGQWDSGQAGESSKGTDDPGKVECRECCSPCSGEPQASCTIANIRAPNNFT